LAADQASAQAVISRAPVFRYAALAATPTPH
jgi:hypothetical protein